MQKLSQGDIVRIGALGVSVILESLAILSVVLHNALLPLGTIYPNVVSVAAIVLPSLVGLLSRRLTVALLLAIAPFWSLGIVYTAIIAQPLWTFDLFSIGALVQRAAGTSVQLLVLGLLGWLVRRLLPGIGASTVV